MVAARQTAATRAAAVVDFSALVMALDLAILWYTQ